uniref:Uncharacterized protein n=2 Tax=Anopheles coluzzii TaxID=1518534 RepID=A0A6E8WDB3_ANOCL|nr:nascent polypeptide-associated complex subunit alpha, muscle-specific form-like isoform X3 [Anopheles coluzzii]
MRKKFVQTLAAQQLEMSTHIRAPGDMEPGKEHRQQQATRTSRDSPQSSEHSRSDAQVIEILDDDNDVELMMERHRKYHPRKYVNLQQPPSKIYYDPVDRPSSPAPDRADQHKQVNGAGEQEEEEEDEERQLVIDCVRDAVSASSSSSKEPNNNSADMANGNHAEERDSNGEPAGPTSLQAPPPTTPAAVPDLTNAANNSEQQQQHQQKSPKKDAAPSSGFNWHVPQNQNLTPVGPPPELRPLLQCPPNVPRPRPDTPAPRMMMMQQQQQQHDRLPPHLRGHRSNPYERPPAGNDHSAALEARRRAATPHPGAMAGHRTPSAPQPTAESARKSAFCAPRESRQPYRSAIMPPPPPLMPSLPGAVASSVAAAPRTPFYHNPFLQPFLHYQPHGGGAPDPQTYHTLEEWYRAGYPAPHLLTPADLDFYYNCFLSKMLFGAAIGYHRQQQQQQHHEQLYRNYPALAMTPGNAFYPPPQYGFVKPITATAPGPVASTTAAPAAATPVPAAANAPSQPINFTQLYNGGAPSSAAAGYHATSLPSTTTAQTHQSPQRVPHTPYFMNHSIPPRPGVMERAGTPAPGHPSAPRPSSAALMPPPPGAASGSRKRSAPSASSAKRPPSGRADPPAYLAPPSQSISMPPSAYSMALPPPSNHPPAGNVAAQHTTNSMPPPSNHAPFDYTHSTAAAAATVTTYATPTILSTMLSSPDRMPPPSNHPPYSTVSDRSPPARSATPAPGRGMPSPTNHHRSPTLGSPSTNMSPESMARPSHPATSNHLISNGNPFPNIMTTSGSMPPPSNHPPSNMGSPTATDTSTAATLLSAGSMPPPSNHPPYHTTTSTSSMSSPGSMPPPSSYPSAGSSNAPTTSSSSMPPPPTVIPNYSSSSFPMMPPIISYLLPPMPPTTSVPSTMSSPSAIPTTSSSSATAAAHNAPASMPSLDTVYASSSMMPPPSTPSTSNRAAASGQPPSPPTTAANTNGSKRGSRAAPKSSPSTSRTPEPPTPPAPKRRNRRASVAASQSPYLTAPPSQLPIPPLPPTPRPPPIATPTDTTLDTTNLGSILTAVRQEMASFLQLRRTDILTTMRIYTGGRTDFALFLAEMKRHNVTYRDFMHVAFALMRRYGQDRFAKEPPSELDYQWANPPQEFATYFSNIHPCTHQFVGENFEFLLLVVDNLLHQYFEPMEYFLLTYVFGVGPRTSGAGWSGSDRALRER